MSKPQVQRVRSTIARRRAARPGLYSRHATPARRGNLLVGCLAVLGVVALIAVIGGVVVYMNWKGWTAGAMNTAMKAAVAETQLSAEQAGRINTQVDQLTAAFEAGDVTLEDLMQVVQALENHPLLGVGLLEYVEYTTLRTPGLTDEERAAGTLATQRLQRGMIEQGLNMKDIESVLEPVSQRGQNGELQPLQNPTAPQVRLYIDAARAKADELGIAEEPYDVDVAEQIERLINDTLGREVVSAPPAPGEVDQGDTGAETPTEEPSEPSEPAEEPVEDPAGTTGGG